MDTKKCKCIESYLANQSFSFEKDKFYDFEHVASTGLSGPTYHVFKEDGGFLVLSLPEFKRHFMIRKIS
ncbi:MAG: hypothetical protein JXJ22_06000 [Bacteroidales bacterium]|nr:hypothetical protein [Bacteroidales bacterium]